MPAFRLRLACLASSAFCALAAPAFAAELSSLSDTIYEGGDRYAWPYEIGLPTTKFTGMSAGAFGQFSSISSAKAPSFGALKPLVSDVSNDKAALGGGATLGWLGKWSRTSAFGYGFDAAILHDGAQTGGTGWRWRSSIGADVTARAGVFALRDNLFIYALGGGAFDYGKRTLFTTAGAESKDMFATGVAIGAGAQMQVFEKLTLRGDLIWKTFQWGKAPHHSTTTGRVGVAYHF